MTSWGEAERIAWRATCTPQRSYARDVLTRIDALRDRYDVVSYGRLDYPEGPYPLLALCSKESDPTLPLMLVTGGVHGYETSGVLGALAFLEGSAAAWAGKARIAVAPCVSPWGYEVVHRWNPHALDPNRNMTVDSAAEECAALVRWVRSLGPVRMHIDLHETTDSDNTTFRPAKAARDGVPLALTPIPDGFYLVGRADRPARAFQAAIRDAVAEVTPIAPADDQGQLIGVDIEDEGIILYDVQSLGLCMGITEAPFATTTEVYPDSPRTDPATCAQAQVTAVDSAIAYALAHG